MEQEVHLFNYRQRRSSVLVIQWRLGHTGTGPDGWTGSGRDRSRRAPGGSRVAGTGARGWMPSVCRRRPRRLSAAPLDRRLPRPPLPALGCPRGPGCHRRRVRERDAREAKGRTGRLAAIRGRLKGARMARAMCGYGGRVSR